MNSSGPKNKEYEALRVEVSQRIKILHQTINLAILILFIFILVFIYLVIFAKLDFEIVLALLLFVPPVFSLVTYNYQANQMTLEAVARFSDMKYKRELNSKSELSWDDFYGKYKKPNRLTSFLKVMPLLLPQIIPILYYGSEKSWSGLDLLFWFDLALFFICLINFRYKL